MKHNFPIFNHNPELSYLDSASTSQKPQSVITALNDFYQTTNANVHRGIYKLSEQSSNQYDQSREAVQKFINAKNSEEIIFTGNATESFNLVAYTLTNQIKPQDEILVTAYEHHANFIPWQQLAIRTGATLKVLEVEPDLTLSFDKFQKLLNQNTKIVAITGMSNVTGYTPNLNKFLQAAKQYQALTIVDASQLIVHHPVDVQKLDCDFLAFTTHKLFGPTGLGILYGKKHLLETLPPFITGGGMINKVTNSSSTWANLPHKFEAGTPKIAQAIAFQKALEFVTSTTYKKIQEHEQKLSKLLIEKFQKHPQVKLFIPANQSPTVISFTMNIAHPHDIASIFDQENVAIRAGHHCCQPLIQQLNIPATARISLSVYNDEQDIQNAEKALQKVIQIFS